MEQFLFEPHLFTGFPPRSLGHMLKALTSEMTAPGTYRVTVEGLLFPLPQCIRHFFDPWNQSVLERTRVSDTFVSSSIRSFQDRQCFAEWPLSSKWSPKI
jgi:hypothetical protein